MAEAVEGTIMRDLIQVFAALQRVFASHRVGAPVQGFRTAPSATTPAFATHRATRASAGSVGIV